MGKSKAAQARKAVTTAPATTAPATTAPTMPTMPGFMASGKGPATMSECKLMSAYITSMEKFSRATTETTAKIANVEKDELVKTAGTFLKDSPQFSGYSSEFSTVVSNFLNSITGNRATKTGDTERERARAVALDCFRAFGSGKRVFHFDDIDAGTTLTLNWGIKTTRVRKAAAPVAVPESEVLVTIEEIEKAE